MKIPVKTILAITAIILALTACGSDASETAERIPDKADVNNTIDDSNGSIAERIPAKADVNNTIDDTNGSIAKTLTRELMVAPHGLANLQGNKLTTEGHNNPDGSRIYTSNLEQPKNGAFVFIRMSESDPIGAALSEDLKKGELVKIVIEAKSNRDNIIQSLSKYGGLGIPAHYFKVNNDKFEKITILFKVPKTYTAHDYFIFRLDAKGDYVIIKSIHVYVKEEV